MTGSKCPENENNELERLRHAFHFTLTDGNRLLQRSDVEGICPNTELCFEFGNNVRCGPCALEQARRHGVMPDISQPFSADEYRLRRRVRAAETEMGVLKRALQDIDEVHVDPCASAETKHELIGKVLGRHQEWISKEFDPALISLSDDGRLSYDGVEYTLARDVEDVVTIVRKVEQWAMDNLTALPGGRWRMRGC